MKRFSNGKGFTLIELLAVLAIIGILMGLVGTAAQQSRQRAYKAKAGAETQQIATAFKSYWIANGKWPISDGGGYRDLTKSLLTELIGEGSSGIVYLDVPEDAFDDDTFVDPWGNPYKVKIDPVEEPESDEVYECAISFPNHFRYYYDSLGGGDTGGSN